MKKTFYTPTGMVEKELTKTEIEEHARSGDGEARKELLKIELLDCDNLQDEVDAIKKFLGV